MKKTIILVTCASILIVFVLLIAFPKETNVLDYGILVKGVNGSYTAEIKIDNISWNKCNDQQKKALISECISIVEIKNGENEDFILTGVSDLSEDGVFKKNSEIFKYYSKNNLIVIDGESKQLGF